MQEIDRIDTTEPIDPVLVINVSPIGIDLRRILIALRKHIPQRKLILSSYRNADVFVPTLSSQIILRPHKDYLIVDSRKKIKLPMTMDGDLLDMSIIDILVAWIEYQDMNHKVGYYSVTD